MSNDHDDDEDGLGDGADAKPAILVEGVADGFVVEGGSHIMIVIDDSPLGGLLIAREAVPKLIEVLKEQLAIAESQSPGPGSMPPLKPPLN